MKSTVTIIDPKKKRLSLNLRELWAYRDLFITLTYRDFRVRYAQTFLGFAWAFLQPLATLAIFTIIFYLADVKAIDGVPFPVFFACGLSAWTYFAFVMNHSGESLINASEMIKKIYFPRLIIPVSKSVVGLVDLIITLLIIGGLMIYFGIAPSVNLIFLPLFILMTIITGLECGHLDQRIDHPFPGHETPDPHHRSAGILHHTIGLPLQISLLAIYQPGLQWSIS